MRFDARKITLFAALISLSLALSVFENFLPTSYIPLPGIKLGLANIVTLYALYVMSARDCAVILFCRCILASIFGGGFTALAFSLCGGFLALIMMHLLKKSKLFSIYGVSIAGAAAHSIGQIFIAGIMMMSFSVVYYLPFLLFAALFTGLITAFISSILISRMKFMYKN